jgi:hypothetical protein
MQAQFLAGQSGAQPAARATRVTRKPPQQQQEEQTQQQPQQLPGPQAPIPQPHHVKTAGQQQEAAETESNSAASVAAEPQQDEQLCPTIPGILSDVKERVYTSAQDLGPLAAAAAGAFPKAVHRKQSKVCLCRGGGDLIHIDMFAHNNRGIAYQGKS